jgi:Holliday junction DNA helicase RuvB
VPNIVKFDDYIGQEIAVRRLKRAVAGAKRRGESFPHTLFHGPPGVGKTTLARVVANELDVPFIDCMAVDKKATGARFQVFNGVRFDLLTYDEFMKLIEPVWQLKPIVFIDEIHKLRTAELERFYPGLQDGDWGMVVPGKYRHDPPQVVKGYKTVTVIGATTELGELPAPFLDRCHKINVVPYKDDELAEIVERKAPDYRIEFADEAAIKRIVCRARRTPRIAFELMEICRDVDTTLTAEEIDRIMDEEGIDDRGLTEADREYLYHLSDMKPRSVSTMMTLMKINNPKTLQKMYENFLEGIGFIMITPRGRVITADGWEHLDRVSERD